MIRGKLKEQIEKILRRDLHARDSDEVLYGILLNELHPQWKEWGAYKLIVEMWKKRVPPMDSVIRYRQRFQQLDPTLRGIVYNERLEKQKEARKDLGYKG